VDEDFIQEERPNFWFEEQRPKNFKETVLFYKKLLYLTGDKTYLLVLISLNSFKIRQEMLLNILRNHFVNIDELESSSDNLGSQ